MTRCNAKCEICYQSAGPRGSSFVGDTYIDTEVVKQLIREAPGVDGLMPKLHLSGGEGFIKQSALISYLQTAQSTGFFREISAVTNAFWAKKADRAEEVIEKCVDAGLTTLEISWDVWHKPYIDPVAIENAVEACNRYGVRSYLRILTTRSHSANEALSLLTDKAIDLADSVVSCPVAYMGRAKEVLPRDDCFDGSPHFKCHSVLNLVVNGGGYVFPCCAGADQTEGMRFGNVNNESIVSISKRIRNSPMLRSLAFGGVSNLVRLLEKKGLFFEEMPKSACQACFEIFNSKAKTKAIKDYFDVEIQQSMTRILKASEQMSSEASDMKLS